jgi:hypothetical protein
MKAGALRLVSSKRRFHALALGLFLLDAALGNYLSDHVLSARAAHFEYIAHNILCRDIAHAEREVHVFPGRKRIAASTRGGCVNALAEN